MVVLFNYRLSFNTYIPVNSWADPGLSLEGVPILRDRQYMNLQYFQKKNLHETEKFWCLGGNAHLERPSPPDPPLISHDRSF